MQERSPESHRLSIPSRIHDVKHSIRHRKAGLIGGFIGCRVVYRDTERMLADLCGIRAARIGRIVRVAFAKMLPGQQSDCADPWGQTPRHFSRTWSTSKPQTLPLLLRHGTPRGYKEAFTTSDRPGLARNRSLGCSNNDRPKDATLVFFKGHQHGFLSSRLRYADRIWRPARRVE